MAKAIVFPQRVEVMGVSIDPLTMAQTVNKTEQLVESGTFAHLIGVNADKVLQMRDNQEIEEIVQRCEIVNADGASMVMASSWLGAKIPERVAGIDLMWELCKLAQRKGYKVCLVGARGEVVEKTRVVLEEKYPGINIAWVRDGYFSEDEFDTIGHELSTYSPQITFVGITSPKKEKLIERFRDLGLTGVYVGVGGSFDVVSGNIPRAPMWMQKARIEWLFRMMQEPGRLAGRYVIGNMRFLLLIIREIWVKRRSDYRGGMA